MSAAPKPSTTSSMVPTTSSASSRSSSARYASSSGSGHASRCSQIAPPFITDSSARITLRKLDDPRDVVLAGGPAGFHVS